MFVFTARLTKKKLIAAVLACGLLLCGLVLLVATREPDASREASGTALVVQGIKTNADRLAYLSSLGWQTGAQETQAQEVRIPDEFNENWVEYNRLQQEQGFDLLKYKGKRVMRYTYDILNHDSGKQDVKAELLVYKNQIIGGDIHLNGEFIQGLTGPSQCSCQPGCEACPSGCVCTSCGGKTGTNTDAEQADAGGETEPDGSLPSSEELNESEYYDAGYYDEGQFYEDEVVSNPDGLPQTPEPNVIEPR